MEYIVYFVKTKLTVNEDAKIQAAKESAPLFEAKPDRKQQLHSLRTEIGDLKSRFWMFPLVFPSISLGYRGCV